MLELQSICVTTGNVTGSKSYGLETPDEMRQDKAKSICGVIAVADPEKLLGG